MPKRPADEYISDDGFVEDGSASPPQYTKRAKTNGNTASGSNDRKVKEGEAVLIGAVQRDDNGDKFWELSAGGARRVTLNEFKGKMTVNVREYYEANGKRLPGKKGISMPIAQFSALIEVLPQIEEALKKKGETIPRPVYDGEDVPVRAVEESRKAAKASNDERQNFEATSDEDED